MSKQGVLTFKQRDEKSHFIYSFRIGDYNAAKILEYIATIPHTPVPLRDNKGRFVSINQSKDQGGGDE